LGRTEMSRGELGRVEVLARVRSGQLRVVDAAVLMGVSYRQGKRLWKRYREEGAAGLKHRSAGRRSHRAYAEKFRQKVLGLVREKYGGPPACAARIGERFGPTLAAEHLASEMPRRCGAGCCKGGYGAGSGGGGDTGGGASARSTLGRWCRWTEAFTRGWRSGDRKGA
jgi:transposase